MGWAWLLLFGCAGDVEPGGDSSPSEDSDDAVDDPCGLVSELGDRADLTWTATLGDVQSCEEPAAEVTYTEVGAAWGLQPALDTSAEHLAGGVVAADDLDGDGDIDVVLGFAGETPLLYERDGEGFVQQEIPGLAGIGGGQNPITLVDLDHDGRRDLLVVGPPPAVVWNRSEGFEVEIWWAIESVGATHALPADFDGDGELDLFVLAQGGSEDERADRLLWGPDWTEEVLPTPTSAGLGLDGFVFDYEQDGDPDVYVVNDQGAEYGGNVLWRNEGGVLSPADCSCDVVTPGMGGDAGDFDGDGLLDLYVSATEHNLLLQQQADHSFVDVAEATGADPLGEVDRMSWGSPMFDHDNDGLLDLAIAEGDLWRSTDESPVKRSWTLDLLVQSRDPEVQFTGRAAELGLDAEGSWRAALPLDHNGDGVLDLLVTDVVEQPRLYLSDGCTAQGWLEVRAPAHSRVTACVAGERRVAWVRPESGWGAAHLPFAHLGLGEHQELEALAVETLDGRVWLSEGALDARRAVTLP